MTPTTIQRDIASGRSIPSTEGLVYRPADPVPGGATYSTGGGLDVTAERSGDRWVFRDRFTGIFGQGATPWEAARDFRTALKEHRDVLERQSELSAALEAQLKYLRARV